MSSLRVSKINKAETATIKNGSGGGAPARFDTSPWAAENALTKSRKVLWVGTGSGDLDVAITDGSSNTAVQVVGLLGCSGSPTGSAGITSVAFKYQAGTYTPGGSFTTMTGAGALTVGAVGRNAAIFLAASVNLATLRISITAGSAFTVGRIFAGTIEVDTTILWSPGKQLRYVQPTARVEGIDQHPSISPSGYPFFEYAIPYSELDETKLALVQTIGRYSGPFLLHDGNANDVQECVSLGDDFSRTNLLAIDGGGNVEDAALTIRSLG